MESPADSVGIQGGDRGIVINGRVNRARGRCNFRIDNQPVRPLDDILT